VVPRVNDVAAPTQGLSHAPRGPAAPTRNMSVVGSMTVPLAKSSGHELSGTKSPSPQCVKGKEAMEIDGNFLGQAIVSGVSDTSASLTLEQEFGTHIVPSATRNQGKDAMDIDDVNAASCVGQPALKANINPDDLELDDDNESPTVGGGSMVRDHSQTVMPQQQEKSPGKKQNRPGLKHWQAGNHT